MGYGRDRGDRDRQRQRRGGGKGNDFGGNNGGYDESYAGSGGGGNRFESRGGGDRPQRPPLQWEEAETLEQGSCRLIIKSAKLQNGGRRLSFSFERVGREDRTSKFFQDRDLDDLSKLCAEAKQWAEADRHENKPEGGFNR